MVGWVFREWGGRCALFTPLPRVPIVPIPKDPEDASMTVTGGRNTSPRPGPAGAGDVSPTGAATLPGGRGQGGAGSAW